MHGRNRPMSQSTYIFLFLIFVFIPFIISLMVVFPTYSMHIFFAPFVLSIIWSILVWISWIYDWSKKRSLAKNKGAKVLVRDSDKNDVWVFQDRIEFGDNEVPTIDIYKIEIRSFNYVQLYRFGEPLIPVGSISFRDKPFNGKRFMGTILKLTELKQHSQSLFIKKDITKKSKFI